MAEILEPGGDRRAWQQLRSNPDYVADWRAHAGHPLIPEPSTFPLRTQSDANLDASPWGLLAWEDPRLGSSASPFWSDIPMLQAAVADHRKPDAPARAPAVHAVGATLTGLRLRDRTLVLKVQRGRRMEQVLVLDGHAFDPGRSGVVLVLPFDYDFDEARARGESLRHHGATRSPLSPGLPGANVDVSVLPPSPQLFGKVFGDGCYSAGGLAVPWSA